MRWLAMGHMYGLRVGSCIYAELSGMQPDLSSMACRSTNQIYLHTKVSMARKQRHTSIGLTDCSKSAI